MVCGHTHDGAWCRGVWPPSWWGLVWWCVAPRMRGRGVVVCGPPHGGTCFVGVCWLVVFDGGVVAASPGRTGRPTEHVRCATPCCCFAGVVTLPLVSPCSAFLCLRGSWAGLGGCALFRHPPHTRGCALRVSSSRRCSSFLLSVLACCRCWPPAGSFCRPSCHPPPPRLVQVSLLPASCCFFSRARAPFCPCSPPVISALCPLPPTVLVCVARVLPPRCSFFLLCPLPVCCCALFGLSVCVGAGCCPSCPPLTSLFVFRGCRFRVLCARSAFFLLPVCPPFVCAWCSPPPPSSCLFLFCGCRRPCCLVLCVAACCFERSGVRCTLLCCAVFCCLRVWFRAALCCFGLPCAAWCPSVLGCVAASGVAPCVLLCRAAVFSAVRLGVVSCCIPCCARCGLAVLSWPAFCSAVLCCVSWRCAALRCFLLFRAVLCCYALRCLHGAVLLFVALFAAASCCAVPWAAVSFAACCAVLCVAAVCCAASLGVVSWCAVQCCSRCILLLCLGLLCCVLCCVLGPIVCRVASCCPMRCSAVVHCGVCVALCYLFLHFSVLLCALPCPRVLCCAVGCHAAWCGALHCCPVLCALCCVYFAVVLLCVLFFMAVRCAAGTLVVSCWLRCFFGAFSKTKKLFPAGVLP